MSRVAASNTRLPQELGRLRKPRGPSCIVGSRGFGRGFLRRSRRRQHMWFHRRRSQGDHPGSLGPRRAQGGGVAQGSRADRMPGGEKRRGAGRLAARGRCLRRLRRLSAHLLHSHRHLCRRALRARLRRTRYPLRPGVVGPSADFHCARAVRPSSLVLPKNRRRLRSRMHVLCHSADARALQLPQPRGDRKRSAHAGDPRRLRALAREPGLGSLGERSRRRTPR